MLTLAMMVPEVEADRFAGPDSLLKRQLELPNCTLNLITVNHSRTWQTPEDWKIPEDCGR